jgi:NitT/TauT family transport system substrate-binding protein
MTSSSYTRRGAFVATLAAGALLLGACSGESAPAAGSDTEPAEMVPVTIGAVFTTAAVPLWIAEDEGIFEEYGLDVTITQSPNFAASAPSLLNGQMQFANAATAPVITAIDQGMPLQIVAGVQAEHDDPELADEGVMVAANSDITRPRDLEGKTIATNAVGSGPYVGVMASYIADGGDPAAIEWVVLNLNEQLPALENGQIDAAIMSEPFPALAKAAGFVSAFNAYRVPGVEVVPGGFADAVLVASTQYLEANPEVGERMRDAMIEANEFAEANPDVVRTLLEERLEIDPTVLETVNLPAFVGEVDPEDVQSMVDAMLQVDLITTELDAAEFVWMP